MNKKNYIYFLFPLVGLVVFGSIYWKFLSSYDKAQETRAAEIKKDKEAKIAKENDLKKVAYEAALKASEQRKAEREAKEKKDEKDREDRAAALENRDKTRREELKLSDKLKSLNKEIEATKKEVADVEENKKKAVDEEAFLRNYVKQAQANRQNLTAVLENIQKADDAAVAAAKAAADAAAKAKK